MESPIAQLLRSQLDLPLARIIVAAALILAMAAGPALSVTKQFDFQATYIASAPVNPVVGSFLLDFDFSEDRGDGSVEGLSAFSINILTGPASYTYTLATDILTVGGTLNGTNGIGSNTNDFFLRIEDASMSVPIFDILNYSQIGGSLFLSTSGTVSASAVPLPSAWPLFLSALIGLAYLRLIRRKWNAA